MSDWPTLQELSEMVSRNKAIIKDRLGATGHPPILHKQDDIDDWLASDEEDEDDDNDTMEEEEEEEVEEEDESDAEATLRHQLAIIAEEQDRIDPSYIPPLRSPDSSIPSTVGSTQTGVRASKRLKDRQGKTALSQTTATEKAPNRIKVFCRSLDGQILDGRRVYGQPMNSQISLQESSNLSSTTTQVAKATQNRETNSFSQPASEGLRPGVKRGKRNENSLAAKEPEEERTSKKIRPSPPHQFGTEKTNPAEILRGIDPAILQALVLTMTKDRASIPSSAKEEKATTGPQDGSAKSQVPNSQSRARALGSTQTFDYGRPSFSAATPSTEEDDKLSIQLQLARAELATKTKEFNDYKRRFAATLAAKDKEIEEGDIAYGKLAKERDSLREEVERYSRMIEGGGRGRVIGERVNISWREMADVIEINDDK
ncbi:hypothetical protein CI109_101432 [Kwoniella shandongensis]|uniref:Uncharacterized protein n=1 Tax=Kwoniella shandongensis TaxID=1734106 RepID=A0A5M6BXC1_9TREE|nr:uncharacterized protein CI109_005128 [Kwoniella shandongensis]KAA5526552.1 hypothetical protein CI109_005128 [Kwoniella shandongensis]